MKEEDRQFNLPDDAFVFAMHQGYGIELIQTYGAKT
jgi:hypothetical protein